MNRSFRTLLSVILVIMAGLPVLFLVYPFTRLVSNIVERNADREIALISDGLTHDVQADIRTLMAQAQSLSRDSDVQRGTRSILFSDKAVFLMKRFLEENSLAEAAYLLNENLEIAAEACPRSECGTAVLKPIQASFHAQIPEEHGYFRIFSSNGEHYIAMPVHGPLERPTGLLVIGIADARLKAVVAGRVHEPTVASLVLDGETPFGKPPADEFRHESSVVINGVEPGNGLVMSVSVVEPKAFRLAAVHETVKWVLLSSGLLAILAGISGLMIARRLSRPFKLLDQHLKKYETGEYEARMPDFSIDEFRLIAETVNSMAQKITAQIHLAAENERVRGEMERTRLETELHSLHQQMQPHFLFNMLNSIGAMIHIDPDRAVRLVNRFSDLYRLILEVNRDMGQINTVPLEKELTVVSHYLELQQVRFGTRLRYSIECDAVLMSLHVPGLLLQTLVENAVKHGIAKSREGGEIRVRISPDAESRESRGRYKCEIINTGARLNAESVGAGGAGIENTRRRLTLLYGDDHRFCLETKEEDRTVASFYFSGRCM